VKNGPARRGVRAEAVGSRRAMLICDDGKRHRRDSKQIEWTDFPAPGLRFYFCNDTLLLPSEY
jgi:hypothetical protein